MEYVARYTAPTNTKTVGNLGLDWLKSMLRGDHYVTVNGTKHKVIGSYVFEHDPKTTLNVTASKMDILNNFTIGSAIQGRLSSLIVNSRYPLIFFKLYSGRQS